MNEVKKLLSQRLEWKPIPGTKRDYSSDKYSKDECSLRMNDFPDEPLWTLIYKGESIDFDETPRRWKINYRTSYR